MNTHDAAAESSKSSRRPLPRRIALAAVLALAALVAGLGLWLALPSAKVPASRLLPTETFAYITVGMHRSDPAIRKVVGLVKDRLSSGAGFFRKAAVSAALPGALPSSIEVVAGRAGPSGGDCLLVYADLGRSSKLLRLAGPAAAKAILRGAEKISSERRYGRRILYGTVSGIRSPFAAYAIVGGTLVIGTSKEAVEDCCARFAAEPEAGSKRASWGAALDQAAALRGAYLYADNRDGALSRVVEAASSRFSFAAFPSIASVASVNGSIQLLEDEIKGTVAFAASAGAKSEDIASDVQFIYGAVKRVARSAGLRLQGEVAADAGGVGFAFSLPGYTEALAAPQKSE
jgi:hypothetical protein